MQQVIQYIRAISAAQFAGIVLLFFLPFVEVSCGTMFTVDISGQQFATGGQIDVPQMNNQNSGIPGLTVTPSTTPTTSTTPSTTPGMQNKGIDPKISAMAAWILAAVGVVLSLMMGRTFRIATAAVGGIGAVLMFWLKSEIDKDLAVQVPQVQGFLQVNYKFAFWACVILFLTAAATNVYMLLKPPDSAGKP